ncbi:MAG: SDR family NAD(P)-dependent oxidoreductase [Bacteroidetes bacterium]|nr:SDR family NAD(P)-dependent oxidoreductase [Bacteroidota bacterium]
MSVSLKGKLACITGASSGIGEATARVFAENGCNLILLARRKAVLDELAASLMETTGVRILTGELDVTDKNQVRKVVSGFPEEFRQIDILVNNAGLALGKDKLQEYNLEEAEQMVQTNILGLIYVTREVLKGMTERKSGHVVNLGSTAGHEVYPGGSIYNATKFAVNALNQGMKMDTLGDNIRVTSVDPGMVNTGFSTIRFRGDKAKADAVYAGMTPLVAEDIADAILWAVTRKSHVNISEIIMMPVDQSSNLLVHRKPV